MDKYPWCGHSVLIDKINQEWQNTDYVYGLFSGQKRQARKEYRAFVKGGISEGKKPELTGGGLLRSVGGWSVLKEIRESGIRVKGDERILGDNDFVENVLKAAEEGLEKKYELHAKGYDFDCAARRVAEVLEMSVDQVMAVGKYPQTVKARSLLCFWAHRKLGITTVEIAQRLNLCQSAVSRLSMKGKEFAENHQLDLI
ncbi:MAG: hypothetical protein ABIK15_15230 [Pseudomonadota bacterium]